MSLEEFKKIIKERECEAWNSFCLAEPRSREEKEMLDRKIAFGEVLELLESAEEPKKVVIPQFVADYIVNYKNDNERLYRAMYDATLDFEDWFEDSDKNSELFVKAWIYDYMVEEPLYIMPVPYMGFPVHYYVYEDGRKEND